MRNLDGPDKHSRRQWFLPTRQTFLSMFLIATLLLTPFGSVMATPSNVPVKKLPKRGKGPTNTGNRILVKYAPSASNDRRSSIQRSAGGLRTIKRLGPKSNRDTHVVELTAGQNMDAALEELRTDPSVIIAEPDYIRKSFFTPNDPGFDQQYGLHNTGQLIDSTYTGTVDKDMDMPEGWDYEQGFSNEVPVAVIDSGIDLTHPELKDKLWRNTGEIPDNNIDDDGNGYVDDVNGYNFTGISQFQSNWATPLGGLDYDVAQSIKGTGRKLTHVGFSLLRRGTPPGDLVIAVRDDLKGPDLATATVSPSEVGAEPYTLIIGDHLIYPPFEDHYKKLSQDITLAEGQTYYLVLSTTALNPEQFYLVGTLSPGIHAYDMGGEIVYFPAYDYYQDGMQHWEVGDKWAEVGNLDFAFRTNPNAVPRDDNGHGTHVSGIIGAETNNGIGVAGVSPGARIMALKTAASGGTLRSSDVIEALYYAGDNGAKVINMSFGGEGSSLLEQLACYYAAGKGATLFAAVGNDGDDTTINYPAAYDNVIGIAATDYNGNTAVFSNWNDYTDLAAPGVHIYSTMPTYRVGMNEISRGDSLYDFLINGPPYYGMDYDYMSGTSMATPMAAGVAALILSRQPEGLHYPVQKVLELGVDDPGFFGHTNVYGIGQVNAHKSLLAMMLRTDTSVTPTTPDGDSGWYRTMPTIDFETDIDTPTTYYSWDSTSSPTTYIAPFQPPGQGQRRLYFYSVDSIGATETMRNRLFKVDTGDPSDPDTVTSPSHTINILSTDFTVDIAFSGATDTISGVGGYSASWSQDVTETPPPSVNLSAEETGTTSLPLTSDNWWFNLRTKDRAGNWTATVHMGPFVIDGPPVTSEALTPPSPNGENSWYSTKPTLRLTPSDPAAVYYQLDSAAAGSWVGDAVVDPFVDVTIPDGSHKVYYFSVNTAGNTETVRNSADIKVDTVKPSGTVKINGGDAKAGNQRVMLTLTGTDSGGSGAAKMRFKNLGGSWGTWENFNTNKFFDLGPVAGTKKAYFQVKDGAGNISPTAFDTIDLQAPKTSVVAPYVATRISKNRTFKVSWSATDPNGVGIKNYDVQYRRSGGSWKNWLVDTAGGSAFFDKGSVGKTYEFRARATDNNGSIGFWSVADETIIPYDNDRWKHRSSGFGGVYKKGKSQFYYGTLRYSARRGQYIVFKFTGKEVLLINTRAKNRSKAKIYIDGKFVKTIDNRSSKTKYRNIVFQKKWAKSGTHWLKIKNLGTPGRRIYDVDALAIRH